MNEDMLVELIAAGEFSQTRIAKIVGVSRRTVWRIANGLSRPDLQRKIAAVVEGYRQAAIRAATKHMKALIEKQVEVALASDGQTARKCREFLIKTFMLAVPDQTAKAPEPEPIEDEQDAQTKPLAPMAIYNSLRELSPELLHQVADELCSPAAAGAYTNQQPEAQPAPSSASP